MCSIIWDSLIFLISRFIVRSVVFSRDAAIFCHHLQNSLSSLRHFSDTFMCFLRHGLVFLQHPLLNSDFLVRCFSQVVGSSNPLQRQAFLYSRVPMK